MDKLTEERTNKFPVVQLLAFSFAGDKEVIRSHLRRKYLNSWKTRNGVR
jgi:hypothetical protein